MSRLSFFLKVRLLPLRYYLSLFLVYSLVLPLWVILMEVYLVRFIVLRMEKHKSVIKHYQRVGNNSDIQDNNNGVVV